MGRPWVRLVDIVQFDVVCHEVTEGDGILLAGRLLQVSVQPVGERRGGERAAGPGTEPEVVRRDVPRQRHLHRQHQRHHQADRQQRQPADEPDHQRRPADGRRPRQQRDPGQRPEQRRPAVAHQQRLHHREPDRGWPLGPLLGGLQGVQHSQQDAGTAASSAERAGRG